MFTTAPLFATNSSNQPSEDDIRGIFSALNKAVMSPEHKKVVMAAITEKIGTIAVISALVSGGSVSGVSGVSGVATDGNSDNMDVEVEDSDESIHVEEPAGAQNEDSEDVEDVEDEQLNVQSTKQFPALPKAAPRQAPIIDPGKAASHAHSAHHSAHHSEEDCDHSHDSRHSHEVEQPIRFKNEPEPCYHFFTYGLLEQNVGTKKEGFGCRFGDECRYTHGAKTSKGRIISERTQTQIDNGTIVCFRRARDGTPCGGAHHIDDCICDFCGSERHISVKCAQCYNCGERGHMKNECPNEIESDPSERGVRVVYGTPTNWKY
jgi:hypothetical protein